MATRRYEELIGLLDQLPAETIRQVEDFVAYLAARRTERHLAEFCGDLCDDEVDRIAQAIEAEFERLRPDADCQSARDLS